MKEQKQKEDDKKVLTDYFIGTLSPLLNKVSLLINIRFIDQRSLHIDTPPQKFVSPSYWVLYVTDRLS